MVIDDIINERRNLIVEIQPGQDESEHDTDLLKQDTLESNDDQFDATQDIQQFLQ
jgi:hypothetical protein